jgi:hypothetical protein
MRYEYHLGIYFRDEDDYRAIDYLVSPATPPPPFHHTLLVYCLHTLRALRNTTHSELGKELAVNLSGAWIMRQSFVEHPDYRLTPFDARRSGRRVLVRATLGDTELEHFNLYLRGFPFFGDAATRGCVSSVGVHFHHLFAKHREDGNRLKALYAASKHCGEVALNGELGILNQRAIALKIAAESAPLAQGPPFKIEKGNRCRKCGKEIDRSRKSVYCRDCVEALAALERRKQCEPEA